VVVAPSVEETTGTKNTISLPSVGVVHSVNCEHSYFRQKSTKNTMSI